jgi:hypothetical protein
VGRIALVYIAGPFRGPTAWDIEQNVRNAEVFGLEIARLGGMPVIPHANTRYFHGQCNDQFWLDGTLRLMEVCDAMVLCTGWECSTGAKGERARFIELGRADRIFDLSGLGVVWSPHAEIVRLNEFIHAFAHEAG